MKTLKIKVAGMSCQHCVKAVDSALRKIEGVISVKVDLASEAAEIVYDESIFDLTKVREAVVDEGYDYQGLIE